MLKSFLLFLLTLLGILSLAAYIGFRTFAFPEHNIQFNIDSKQAGYKSSALASKLGINTDKFESVTLFTTDDEYQTFLEKSVGAKETGRLASEGIPVWTFTTRFFKPLTNEELMVDYDPQGRLVAFSHVIDESAVGPSLEKNGAQKIAEDFLSQNCYDCKSKFLEEWKQIAYSERKMPKRLDHVFYYQKKDFNINGAISKRMVVVNGDKVGLYSNIFQIPEDWSRSYERQRSYNNLAQIIASVFFVLFLVIPSFFVVLKSYKQFNQIKTIPILLGIVTSLIYIISYFNQYDTLLFSYPKNQPFQDVIILRLVGMLLYVYVLTFAVALIVAAAEKLYREVFENNPHFYEVVKNIFKVPSITKGIFIGFIFGFLQLSYILIYYFLGQKVGFWTPAEVNYSDSFNSMLPWIYPLTIGFTAAVTEEFIFRMFGISFFKKIFKNTYLAVLISSIIWAFMHSQYPQEPFFARGLELTIAGVAFSWLFLRYGILSSISAHFVLNASLYTIFFLNAKNTYVIASSIFVTLIPLWIVIIGLFVQKVLRKTKQSSELPTNSQVSYSLDSKTTVEKIEPSIRTAKIASPFSSGKFLLVVGLTLILGVIAFLLPDESSSLDKKLIKNPSEIRQIANEFLSSKSVNYSDYHVAVTNSGIDYSKAIKTYLSENTNKDEVNKFLKKSFDGLDLWYIRYFKPQSKEEYMVKVTTDGKVFSYQHIVSADEFGSVLSQNQAQKVVYKYLGEQKIDTKSISLVGVRGGEKKNRKDYVFTFQYNEKIKEASLRFYVDVLGDEPQNIRYFIDIPEDWIISNSRIKTLDLIKTAIAALLILVLPFIFGGALVFAYKKGMLGKRVGTSIAFFYTVTFLLLLLNRAPNAFYNYPTSLPLWVYIIMILFFTLLEAVFIFILIRTLVNIALGFYKHYIGELLPIDVRAQKLLFRDGLFSGLLFVIFSIIMYFGVGKLSKYFGVDISSFESASKLPTGIDSFIPSFLSFQSLMESLLSWSAVVVFLAILRRYLRSWKAVFAFLFISTIGIILLNQSSKNEIIEGAVVFLPMLIFTLLYIFLIARNNIFAYILPIFYLNILQTGLFYTIQPNMFWDIQGIVYLLMGLVPFVLWWRYEDFLLILTKKWIPFLKDSGDVIHNPNEPINLMQQEENLS